MPSELKSLLTDEVLEAMSNEQVAERLKALRMIIGLSSSEISDSLGIQRTHWSRYENGRQGLSKTVAALLVIRYGVTLDFLYLGRTDKLPFDLVEALRSFDA